MPQVAQQTTDAATLVELYRYMRMARAVDALEQDFTRRGEAFFHVSGAGHEAAAALWPHLIPEDWLQAHYRDKALLLARGVTPETMFLALFAKDASESRGRAMNAISPPCASKLTRPLRLSAMAMSSVPPPRS